MSESENHSVVSNSWRPLGLYRPWVSPGQNTGVGGLSLLQGIIPTQGSNPGLPQCRRIPRILEWVVYPFSSRSSQTRKPTGVSCITGRFLTTPAIREAPREFEFGGQWDLITELPQDLRNRLLRGTNKTLCAPGARRKEQYSHKRLVQESLVEPWINSLASGQTTGREHSPTHEQNIRLK